MLGRGEEIQGRWSGEFLKCEVNFMYSQVIGNSMPFIQLRVVNWVYSHGTREAVKELVSQGDIILPQLSEQDSCT